MARKKSVKQPKSALEFMQYLGSELACYKANDTAASGMVIKSQADIANGLIGDLDALKKDSYFIVNPGGTKAKDIKAPVACYIDLDAGRDSKKQYLSEKKVAEKKDQMTKRIVE